jgi:hypothetical protein
MDANDDKCLELVRMSEAAPRNPLAVIPFDQAGMAVTFSTHLTRKILNNALTGQLRMVIIVFGTVTH